MHISYIVYNSFEIFMKEATSDTGKIAIWGGVECTINRVHEQYYYQLIKGGHIHRINDLDLIAGLGIKTLRYPVLWEQVAPEGVAKADWSWTDARLEKLRSLGITPIAGLLHHGSGPYYTSLVDPDFPAKLAEYALAVAERYPWLEYFTPVNEPLTTARFSGLYGIWYPHGTDDKTFSKCFIHQLKGVTEAMKAIRKVIPHAKLVQTEDLGKTHSTKHLDYQAEFENDRRWSTFDLLNGKVNFESPFVKYLVNTCNIEAKELEYFTDNPCPPDILGVNHYITSERYLDHRLEKYPQWLSGNNGKDEYVDVEVVRVAPTLREGHYNLLKETYERYKRSIAVTELHLGCTREEQLRWFKEAYESCQHLKEEGVDVLAVTAWSLLGAYDWNSLLAKDHHHYEPGVFDLRNGEARPTAIAHYIKALNEDKTDFHPVLHSEGWWRRPESILFPDDPEFGGKTFCEIGIKQKSRPFSKCVPPLLITGGTGTLGRAFARLCDLRAIPFILLNRQDMDIADQDQVNRVLSKYQPWALINTAGFVKVDEAQKNQQQCFRENTTGPVNLARACQKYNIKLISFSSDMVFDGNNRSSYLENHSPNPLNTYGLSKLKSEQEVLKIYPSSLIIRTSSFFGPWDNYNFLTMMMNTVQRGEMFIASKEHIVSPTYVPDLVNACLDLIIDDEKGIWHLTNPSEITWGDFALKACEMARMDTGKIHLADCSQLKFVAPRPKYSAMGSKRGILLPGLEHAMERFLSELETTQKIVA